jgi:hypothetical protein
MIIEEDAPATPGKNKDEDHTLEDSPAQASSVKSNSKPLREELLSGALSKFDSAFVTHVEEEAVPRADYVVGEVISVEKVDANLASSDVEVGVCTVDSEQPLFWRPAEESSEAAKKLEIGMWVGYVLTDDQTEVSNDHVVYVLATPLVEEESRDSEGKKTLVNPTVFPNCTGRIKKTTPTGHVFINVDDKSLRCYRIHLKSVVTLALKRYTFYRIKPS